MTFWDFCAPFYDLAESANGRAYNAMIEAVRDLVPQGASVLEAAAGQVLHLIDEPRKAAAELRRVAKRAVILPMSFTKDMRGFAKFGVGVYRLPGFAPKMELDVEMSSA